MKILERRIEVHRVLYQWAIDMEDMRGSAVTFVFHSYDEFIAKLHYLMETDKMGAINDLRWAD
jgi:hypothetical protein